MSTFFAFFSTYKKLIGSALVLLIAAFSWYLTLSFRLETTQVFQEYDLLFELDPPRAITDLADYSGDHYRTTVHPIYVLLANPGGSLIRQFTGSEVSAALIANAFWGAAGVAMAFFFFWSYGKRLLSSFLLAALFGLSMSQTFLSATPDTATMAVCSLILTYILFLKGLEQQVIQYWWWLVGGILTIGVTITNFAQTLICFTLLTFVVEKEKRSFFQMGLKVAGYALLVVGLTVILALLQKWIYPTSGLFFIPSALMDEKDFSTFLVFDAPVLVVLQELKHFLVINFIAPFADTYTMPDQNLPAITFSTSWHFSRFGQIGLFLWLSLLLGGLVNCWRVKRLHPFFLGVLLCLLFNAALHSVYGGGEKEGVVEYFLYTGNFTFLVLTFLAPYAPSSRRWVPLWFLLLAILMGVNNYLVLAGIVEIYGG